MLGKLNRRCYLCYFSRSWKQEKLACSPEVALGSTLGRLGVNARGMQTCASGERRLCTGKAFKGSVKDRCIDERVDSLSLPWCVPAMRTFQYQRSRFSKSIDTYITLVIKEC